MRAGIPQKHTKAKRGVGGPKITPLELTYILDGPHPKKVGFMYFNQNSLNMMCSVSSENLFSVLTYLQFYLDFFGYIRKRLDKKAKVNFQIYDVTNWNTKNHNRHITRHHKK